jgi:hypothetical protein
MESVRLLLVARVGLVPVAASNIGGSRGGGVVVASRGRVVIASPRDVPTATLVVGPQSCGLDAVARARACLS